jgi:hypothetical protein
MLPEIAFIATFINFNFPGLPLIYYRFNLFTFFIFCGVKDMRFFWSPYSVIVRSTLLVLTSYPCCLNFCEITEALENGSRNRKRMI